MITGNGIDRNTYQGITVFSGASNALVTNTLHSNGTGKDNTYAHIDVGLNVVEVCVSNNNFGPLDAGITNVASYCVNVAGAATKVVGHIGAVDPTAARAVANVQASGAPWALVSNVGAVVQGAGSDILHLVSRRGTTVAKVTDDGSFVHSGGGCVTVNGMAGAADGARFVGGTKSGAPTSGSWQAGDFSIDQTGKVWIYTGSAWVASH
jgi:hypothetical protein